MNPNPSVSIDSAIRSGGCSRTNPSASSTSAEPEIELTARFPCLATAAPAAAATIAAVVEMLNVREPSPPVPTTSTTSARVGVTASTCARIASAHPAISSAVSPFARSATRKPPICAGVASPPMISLITACASSRPRSCPSRSFWIAARITWESYSPCRQRLTSVRLRCVAGLRPRARARPRVLRGRRRGDRRRHTSCRGAARLGLRRARLRYGAIDGPRLGPSARRSSSPRPRMRTRSRRAVDGSAAT